MKIKKNLKTSNFILLFFKWHQSLACDRPVTHLATHL